MVFYLDSDFPCLWRCNFYLLNREWFIRGPGNSSPAPDNLKATKRNTLQGKVYFCQKARTVVLQSPKPELHNMHRAAHISRATQLSCAVFWRLLVGRDVVGEQKHRSTQLYVKPNNVY